MRRRGIALILLVAIGAPAVAGAGTRPQEFDEYQVKAAFLYNFARFVEWPDEAFPDGGSPLRVCVLGKHQFGRHLDTLEGKSIQGRPVSVIEPGSSLALAQTCHVLFISRSLDDVGSVVSSYAALPILTVTESEDGESAYGIINLIKAWSDSNGDSAGRFRIVFEIDVAAAEKAGLQLGSRLLELAIVRNGKR